MIFRLGDSNMTILINIDACVFDVYVALFDVTLVVEVCQ
jgi:hypothetical protein